MKLRLSWFLTVLFFLGSVPLWADAQKFAGSEARTLSKAQPAVPSELGNAATPAEPGQKVNLQRAKKRHEGLQMRWEEDQRKLRKRMEAMIRRHPERADEIRQKYAKKSIHLREQYERRLKRAKERQNWHERIQERRAHSQERAQLRHEQRRDQVQNNRRNRTQIRHSRNR